jgi:hypothetical protein
MLKNYVFVMSELCSAHLALRLRQVSDRVPFIADLKPSGKYVMEDLHKVCPRRLNQFVQIVLSHPSPPQFIHPFTYKITHEPPPICLSGCFSFQAIILINPLKTVSRAVVHSAFHSYIL